MKKLLLFFLATALMISLCSCSFDLSGLLGGGDGEDEKDGDKSTSDPLNREGGLDLGSIMGGLMGGVTGDPSGEGITDYRELSPSEKQAIIDAGKEDGVDISFTPDGKMVAQDENGDIVVQNPDGTWTVQGEDGMIGQIGGDWPENEFTAQVPRPEFPLLVAGAEESEFTASFTGVTLEQIRDYTEKLKAAGFTENAETQDETLMGMTMYSYTASNADGYTVELFSAIGVSGLTIKKGVEE